MSWLTIWKPLPPAIDAWTTNADRLVEMASKIPGQLWHQGWLGSTGQVFVPEARRILTAIETVVVASDFLYSGCDVRALLTECMTTVSNITTPLDVLNFAMRLRHLAGLLAK